MVEYRFNQITLGNLFEENHWLNYKQKIIWPTEEDHYRKNHVWQPKQVKMRN